MSEKPKPSIPPPAPAPWSRPRDDQPTTEMRAAAVAIADSVSTSEFSAAGEPVTEKIDKDELSAVRADGSGVIDRRNRRVPSPPDPNQPTPIPVDDVKTDVMSDPPDFGEEFRGIKRAGNRPIAVAAAARPRLEIVPSPGPRGAVLKFGMAVAIALVGFALWFVFVMRH